jgi:hypothetical protein
MSIGVDPGYAALKGYEKYQKDYPVDIESNDFKANFYEKVSKMSILKFYLANPSRMFQILKTSAEHSATMRPRYLANVKNPEQPRQQSYRFSLWEKARTSLPLNNLAVIGVMMAAHAAMIARKYMLAKAEGDKTILRLMTLLAAVEASAAISFVMPYIGNGLPDLSKHMFGFVYLFDIVTLSTVSMLLKSAYDALLKLAKPRKSASSPAKA